MARTVSRRKENPSRPASSARPRRVMVRPPIARKSMASKPPATIWRMMERHSVLSRSRPTPKVGNRSWRRSFTLAVALPVTMSVKCAAPKRWPVRWAADKTFWASVRPSTTSGGFRQLSQFPHGSVGCSPNAPSSGSRRQCTPSQYPSSMSSRWCSRRRNSSSACDCSMKRRRWPMSSSPYSMFAWAGSPSLPARPIS